jgi:hypothetical protein
MNKKLLLSIAAIGLLLAACAPGAAPAPSEATPSPQVIEPTPTSSPVPAMGPKPGITFDGTIETSGKAKSGTLKFTISEDGFFIASLGVTLNDLQCDGLSAGSYSDFLGTLRASVTDGKFTASLPAMGGMISNFKQEYKPRPTLASLSDVGKIEGAFISPTEASGTIKIFLGIPMSRTACEFGNFDWSAKGK